MNTTDEDDAELYKLDSWIQQTEAKSRIAKIFRNTVEANRLDLLARQAHVYAGKLRTLRTHRVGHRMSNEVVSACYHQIKNRS